MAEQLLPEILVDIFLRLPIKTICQLICVCKHWNSLITSPSFVKAHLNRPNQDSLLYFQGYLGYSTAEFHMIYRDNAVFDKYDEFVCPFKNSFCGYFRVVGYCDGVICLNDDQYTYKENYTFLWNPSIKMCVVLPEPRVTFHTHGPYNHAFGFGYDNTSNDYKVVRIVHLQSSKFPSEVDVYRLSTRTWHNISHLGLTYNFNQKAPQVYLNGASHWLAYDKKNTRHMVVAFVMADEVFHYIESPGTGRMNLLMQPCDYHGSLAVIESVGYGFNETWSLWVMKNYGATNSWTKQSSIRVYSGIDCLFVAKENDEEIFASATGEIMCHSPGWGTYMLCLESVICFRETGEVLFGLPLGYILAYHPRTGFKKLELHGLERPYFPLFATSYRESIALIGNQGYVLPGAKTGEDQKEKVRSSCMPALKNIESWFISIELFAVTVHKVWCERNSRSHTSKKFEAGGWAADINDIGSVCVDE